MMFFHDASPKEASYLNYVADPTVTPTQTGHTFISLKHTNIINELSVHNLSTGDEPVLTRVCSELFVVFLTTTHLTYLPEHGPPNDVINLELWLATNDVDTIRPKIIATILG